MIRLSPTTSLGDLLSDWIEHHCTIPDGFRKGEPFQLYPWQWESLIAHYEIKPGATDGQLAPAFKYRRSQIVAPQKTGKGPFAAAIVAGEALGPALFDGFAEPGDVYRCSEHGCEECTFVREYAPGSPRGKSWPTPLIQLLASAEEQVANTFRPLQVMLKHDNFGGRARVGEAFIRLPNDGRIEAVTSSATARLGNPITFALMDETHLYTKSNKLLSVAETMRRGVAGMGGRSMETTNAWDPAESSAAQRTSESTVEDIYKYHRIPPAKWSYGSKADRLRIHRFVYNGSTHVDLDAIEAEAAELVLTDPMQAERFFGNRIVHGHGTWLPDGLWENAERVRDVAEG